MSLPDDQWQLAAQSKLAALAAHLGNLKQLPLPQGRTEDYTQKLSDILKAAGFLDMENLDLRLQPATRRALEVACQGIGRASGLAQEALQQSEARLTPRAHTWKDKAAIELVGLARQLERCAHYVLALAETVPDVLSSSATAKCIALAGTAVTGMGSLALTTVVLHPVFIVQMESHAFFFDTLLRVLTFMHERQPQVFAALRANTFSRDVVIMCLSRILGWHRTAMASGWASELFPASAAGTRSGFPNIAMSVCQIFGYILPRDSAFSSERAAIEADSQLQDTIITFMATIVQNFALGTGSPSKEAVYALHALSFPSLAAGLCARATRPGSGFVSLMGKALTRLLVSPVKEAKTGNDPSLQYRGLFGGVGALCLVFTSGEYPQPANTPAFVAEHHPQLLDELLGALTPAVSAVMALLEWDCTEEYCQQGAAALSNLLPQLAAPGMPAALARRPLEVVRIIEALTRLATQIRSTQAATPPGTSLPVVEGLFGQSEYMLRMPGLQEALLAAPRAVFLGRDGLSAVAALLQTTAKLGLLLAKKRSSGNDHGVDSPVLRIQVLLQVSILLLQTVSFFFSDSSGGGDVSGEAPTQNLRRWKAVALALCSVVTPLARKEGRLLVHGDTFRSAGIFSLIINMLCSWCPGVCSTVMSTEAGCAAAMHAFSIFKDPAVMGAMIKDTGNDRMMLTDKASSSPPMALALARSGTLAELVAWGEANCVHFYSDAEVKRTLTYISAAVKQACGSAGTEAVCEALAGIPTFEFGFEMELLQAEEFPSYWQRLQAEVVGPLAAHLAARPTNAAAATHAAVAVAEALATRPCSHPKCTTIVGCSEASAPGGKRCAGCRLVRYCGRACQVADWKAHKAACQELQRREGDGGQLE